METLFEVRGADRRLSDDFALADANIALQPGEIVGFVGANGAGKTTVIRAILGLLHLDSGNVRLFGQPFGATAPAEAQRRLRSRIGVVFDTCPFPAELKVKQAIACVAPAFARWDAQRFASLLDEFDIPPKAKVRDLSRGMGMKLQLAVALSHGADLLILDEATAGLDPIARDGVLDRLREFASDGQRGVLLSSHITSDLERVADRVVGIDAGRIAFNLPREQITDDAGVAHCTAEQACEVMRVLAEVGQAGAELDIAEGETPANIQVSDLSSLPTAGSSNRTSEHTGTSAAASPNDHRASQPADPFATFGISTPRAIRRAYCTDVLVPNRFAFAQAFPEIACDRATIEDYLQFALNGECRLH